MEGIENNPVMFELMCELPWRAEKFTKEWNGLLRDFYYKRWEKYWQVLQDQLDGKLPVLPVGNSSTPTADNPAMTIDWYALEEPWTLAKNTYAASAEGDCIEVAKEAITLINN